MPSFRLEPVDIQEKTASNTNWTSQEIQTFLFFASGCCEDLTIHPWTASIGPPNAASLQRRQLSEHRAMLGWLRKTGDRHSINPVRGAANMRAEPIKVSWNKVWQEGNNRSNPLAQPQT